MRTIAVISQYQDLVALYHYYNIDITAKTQVVEGLIVNAESLFYSLGEADGSAGTIIDNLIIDSDLPPEVLNDPNAIDAFKATYYRAMYFMLSQLDLLDLPNGVKYVYSMDDYKIVLEIADY